MSDKKRVALTNSVVIKAISSESVVMESKALNEDEFSEFYGQGNIIEPLYNPEQLTRLSEYSDILQQCIDAYKTNITGFGHNFKYDVDYDKEDKQIQSSMEAEWTKYESFFKYCSIDESFSMIMKKVIDDRERIGWGAVEVIEDGAGQPAGFEHIPGHKVRFCKKDTRAIPVTITINTGEQQTQITVMKKFRKYVQIVDHKRVYFKEFGDPREMDCTNGEYRDGIPSENKATSLIVFTIYSPYTPYGMPRYIGQLLNIQGNRSAEELNYAYFKDGRHMPLAIIVENGKLTEGSLTTLSESKGNKARHKYIILEAEGLEKDISLGDDDTKTKVNIRLEKLAEMLEKDGLFQEYCKNNRDKIRSSFRLHPIYTGESQDYNRATANTARQVTEEQVFEPERGEIAYKFNNLLRPRLGVNQVSMYFVAPSLSDQTEIARAITPYVQAGAASPNMLLDSLGALLNKNFEQYDEDWANIPLSITLKNLESLKEEHSKQENEQINELDEKSEVRKSDNMESIINILKGLESAIMEVIKAA